MRTVRVQRLVIDRMQRQWIVLLARIDINLEDRLAAGRQEILYRRMASGPNSGIETEIETGGGCG